MPRKSNTKIILAAYALPPTLFLAAFYFDLVPLYIFAAGQAIILGVEVLLYFLPKYRKMERTLPLAYPAVIAGALLVAAGTFLGVMEGKIVFEKAFKSDSKESFKFDAAPPLDVVVQGEFGEADLSKEIGRYSLSLSGDRPHELKGEFRRQVTETKRGKKRRYRMSEFLTGFYRIEESGSEKTWTLKVNQLEENISNNFKVRVTVPYFPHWIAALIGLMIVGAIGAWEYRISSRLAKKTRFNKALCEEFPPATWLVLSCFLFLLFYPISTAAGAFIERGFVVSIPGAIVGGIILTWFLQQWFYKKLSGKIQ